MQQGSIIYSDKLALVGYSMRSADGEPVALISLRHDTSGNEKSDFTLRATAQPWDLDKINANLEKLGETPVHEQQR